MSEEQTRETVKRSEEPQPPQTPQAVSPETSWSVPPPQIEMPETTFEPLRPLEPALGEAIAQSFEIPQMPEFGEILLPDVVEGTEDMRRPMNRPAAPLMGDVCPQGLAGLCIWCGQYPCDYMLKRALRFLLTTIEYGGGGRAPT